MACIATSDVANSVSRTIANAVSPAQGLVLCAPPPRISWPRCRAPTPIVARGRGGSRLRSPPSSPPWRGRRWPRPRPLPRSPPRSRPPPPPRPRSTWRGVRAGRAAEGAARLLRDDHVPYVPIDVDLLMGNDEVALRGPWDRTNLIGVAPTAAELSRGLFDYHLDFPGDTLDPGCTYEEWARRLRPRRPPDDLRARRDRAGVPGQAGAPVLVLLRLQRLEQQARGRLGDDPARLRRGHPAPRRWPRGPTEVGYSQHSSAERADWGDDKLELVGGTHPVVYPAAGSRPTSSRRALPDAQPVEGVGCDDARGPSPRSARPWRPSPPTRADYLRAYPWLGFDGRWGEQQRSFFNGPTAPNDEDPVDRADHLVEGELARQELHGPGGRRGQHLGDRLLLRRGRGRLGGCCAGSRPTPDPGR